VFFCLAAGSGTGERPRTRGKQTESTSGDNPGPTASDVRVERASTVRELLLLDGDAEEAGWQERALCAQTDPEAFFPEKGGSTREAKKVCLTCEVRNDCLEYALMNDERFGIWGGLSERERRKLKKQAV
jgi:WhiB family redox-sensing transcriptional regulator